MLVIHVPKHVAHARKVVRIVSPGLVGSQGCIATHEGVLVAQTGDVGAAQIRYVKKRREGVAEAAIEVERCLRTVLHTLHDVVQRVLYRQRFEQLVHARQLEVVFAEAARQGVGHFVHIGIREAVARHLGALRYGHRVGLVPARAEEFFPGIVGLRHIGAHLAVPVEHGGPVVARTERLRGAVEALVGLPVPRALIEATRLLLVVAVVYVVAARTVDRLHLRQIGGHVGRHLRGEVHRQFALRSTLAGDDHRSVGRLRAIEGRGRSPLQDGNALDVLGIDVHDAVGTYTPVVAKLGEVRRVARVAVADRHTVQDDDGLVVARNGSQATHVDGHAAGRTTLRLVDAYARSLAVEGRAQIGCPGLHQIFGIDGTHGIAQPLGVFLDAHRGDYHLAQHLRVLGQHHAQVARRLAFELHVLGHEAHIGHGNGLRTRRYAEHEVAVYVGDNANGRALRHYTGTYEGFACRVSDSAPDGRRCFLCHSRSSQDRQQHTHCHNAKKAHGTLPQRLLSSNSFHLLYLV